MRKKVAGLLRAGAYLSVALGIVSVFGVRAAKAEVARKGLSFGKALVALAPLDAEKASLRINGQDLFISNALVDRDASAVLDSFEELCKSEGSALADPWPKAARKPVSERTRRLMPRLDVVRREENGEGVVFCFAKSGGRSFADAATELSNSRDLSALGHLRYAYVKREEGNQSRVLATWTDGSFKIGGADAKGDAIGSDPGLAPRPPRATRVLSATLEGTPYGMYAFTSDDPAERVLGFFDESLRGRGFVTVRAPDGSGHAYEKDGAQIFVSAVNQPESGPRAAKTLISIGELGAAGARSTGESD